MKRRNLIADITLSGLFCALICVGAFIKIPIPNMPITMQVFFVILSGLILPWKTALAANAAYMLLGLIGIPLFTGGGGLGYVLMPTFGFVLGFILAAAVMSLTLNKCKKNSLYILFAAGLTGLTVIYAVGIPYFTFIMNTYRGGGDSFADIAKIYILPFIPKDIISLIAAVLAAYKLRPAIAKIK